MNFVWFQKHICYWIYQYMFRNQYHMINPCLSTTNDSIITCVNHIYLLCVTWNKMSCALICYSKNSPKLATFRVSLQWVLSGVIEYVHPRNPLRTIKMTICNHQADSPTLCVVWCLILWFASLERKYTVLLDTKCPYWDHLSLNSTDPSLQWTWDVKSNPLLEFFR